MDGEALNALFQSIFTSKQSLKLLDKTSVHISAAHYGGTFEDKRLKSIVDHCKHLRTEGCPSHTCTATIRAGCDNQQS
jgi:hypothetical protein